MLLNTIEFRGQTLIPLKKTKNTKNQPPRIIHPKCPEVDILLLFKRNKGALYFLDTLRMLQMCFL